MPKTPLSLDASGAAVEQLHAQLQQLGFTVAASEIAGKKFGPATKRAVREFQKQNGLPVTGKVSAKTTAKLVALTTPAPTPTTENATAAIKPVLLPGTALNQPVLNLLASDIEEKQVINTQLNAALKAQLISSAAAAGLTALAGLLQNLASGDLAAAQNLSLRDFVTKYTTQPAGRGAKQAQTAIATLSSTTTVGALLGLDGTVADNPVLSGIAAQTNLAALLGTSPALGSAQLQTDFIAKYAAFPGTAQEFWAQLGQDAGFSALVPELQFTMQLGVLTLNNPPLVSALRTTFNPASMRDLATLDAPTLEQFLTSKKIAVPAGIPGSTPAEQVTNYANGMISLLEAAFPTRYVAKALAAATDPTLQLAAKVLSQAPEIDLQSTNLDAYLQQNSAAAFEGVPPGQVVAVTAQLKSVQRLFRISPDASTIQALLTAGLDSAAKITVLPRSAFVDQFSSALGGDTQAQGVYASASHINAQALNAYRTIQSGLREISPRAIGNPAVKLAQNLQQQIPNWEDLFGSTSYCECGECGSVYGPAAYFVDLLQFLRSSTPNSPVAPNLQGYTPLDVLIGSQDGAVKGRRPDLPYIKLDCQNADTPLPYIDLINEILESYIVLGGTLDATTAQNTPSDATPDELALNPEYTLDKAYATLSAATFPLSLPYDRYLDVARRYLAFLGGNRREVIQLFQTEQAPVDTACMLAAESLGLSYAEVKLIAGWDFQAGGAAASVPLGALYGVPATVTGSWETWISSVPTFLQQTGLEFADLINLLETQFINPGQTIILQGADTCDLTNTTIESLDDAALGKILPFIRLWRKLGWSMSDLDKVLRTLAPSGINRGCLLALADVAQLQAQLNLSLPQLMSLWSNIDTDGRDSLYLTLFQNKAVLNPIDTDFQLTYRAALPALPATALPPSAAGQITYDGVNLTFIGSMTDGQRADLFAWAAGNAGATLAVDNLYEMRWAQGTDITLPPPPAAPPTLTGHVAGILAALRISSDDLNAIRAATGLTDTTIQTPLNLANLSTLYRYAIFAQALGLSIPDFISLISLTGINPFQLASAGSAIAPAVQFLQASQAIQASSFSVAQLNYIYRAIANPAAGVGPLEANMDLLTITLQTGLQKIAATNAYTPDPTGKLLRQKLGVLLDSTQLTAAMGLIDGSAVYTSSLAALPAGVIFPGPLATLVSYDSANQLLKFSGVMSDADEATLTGLSPTDVPYQNAVADLYQQPRTILATDLAFLNAADALTQLINSPSPDPGDRYSWVLQNLLSYLTDTQSRSLVQQSLSQLALFAPPIDPGQLIRALAMGMDLNSALSDINAALPFYRFTSMLPKALELCAEVRSLGASLLSALEKSDAEGLSMLRATQETALLTAIRNVKQNQLNEANSNVDALTDSLAVSST